MCTEEIAIAVGNSFVLKRNIPKPRTPINSDFNIPEERETTIGAEPRPFMIFDN